ncbi:MAG: peptide chain release factor-like protein [Elusimicrobiales bacterium]|nr:peptide chain release factor-like protein [Elusimicrobiales bacterium]MCK5106425.1 peptide chain release factor-like protein [Elusimicrobiales bacterium]MCK5357921.1 peptide chain release factor-like protein [Elusimicrobiales bacterium]
MKFLEFSDIKPSKVEALKIRVEKLNIPLDEIEEKFIKGSGKGGQKINKTSNAVMLKYPPLKIIIKCQKERKRSLNRFLALRELVDRIEMKISPETSSKLKTIEKLKKKKSNKKNKASKKHGNKQ